MLLDKEIKFSGNYDQANAFSVAKFNHLMHDYNETIVAAEFLTKYTERTHNSVPELKPLDTNQFERLISGLALIRSQHTNKYNPLSSFLTLRLFGLLEDYEAQYKTIVTDFCSFKYSFGLDAVIAFDKLVGNFNAIKKHCKKTPQMQSVEKFITDTMDSIGAPYNKYITGNISLSNAINISSYMCNGGNRINLLALYKTILLFQEEQQKASDEKLRAKRFGATKYAKKESDKMLNASVDANIGLYQENQELRSRIAKLESENKALTTQLAQAQKNVFSRALDKIKGKLR